MNALAHDSEVARAFPDGVLWAALGAFPNPLGKLMAWARALGARARSHHGLEDLVIEVRSLLQDRQVLLIADDVYEVSAAVPFKVGEGSLTSINSQRISNLITLLSS